MGGQQVESFIPMEGEGLGIDEIACEQGQASGENDAKLATAVQTRILARRTAPNRFFLTTLQIAIY